MLFDERGRAVRQRGRLAPVRRASGARACLSTDDLVATLSATSGASLPIWVTEAGAHVDDNYVAGQTEAEQDSQVRWMTDTTSGLASHDRITRMHYYHMREEPDTASPTCQTKPGFPWDTGLVRACGDQRAGVVHLVPGDTAERCRAATTTRRRRPRGRAPGSTSSGAATGTTPRSTAGPGTRIDLVDARSGWAASRRRPGRGRPGAGAARPVRPAAATTPSGCAASTGRSGRVWTWLGSHDLREPGGVARQGTSTVDVFVRGPHESRCYHRSRNGSTWSAGLGLDRGAAGRRDLGARRGLERGPGGSSVFVRGGDAAIWRRHLDHVMGPVDEPRRCRDLRAGGHLARHGQARRLRARRGRGRCTSAPTAAPALVGWTALGGTADLGARRRGVERQLGSTCWARGTDNSLRHNVWQAVGLVRLERDLVPGPAARLVGREVRVPLAERAEGAPELALRVLVVERAVDVRHRRARRSTASAAGSRPASTRAGARAARAGRSAPRAPRRPSPRRSAAARSRSPRARARGTRAPTRPCRAPGTSRTRSRRRRAGRCPAA